MVFGSSLSESRLMPIGTVGDAMDDDGVQQLLEEALTKRGVMLVCGMIPVRKALIRNGTRYWSLTADTATAGLQLVENLRFARSTDWGLRTTFGCGEML